MKDKILFEKYWGNIILSIDFRKFDLLPRVTASFMTNAFIINAGIFGFILNFTVWGKMMRKFNQRYESKG